MNTLNCLYPRGADSRCSTPISYEKVSVWYLLLAYLIWIIIGAIRSYHGNLNLLIHFTYVSSYLSYFFSQSWIVNYLPSQVIFLFFPWICCSLVWFPINIALNWHSSHGILQYSLITTPPSVCQCLLCTVVSYLYWFLYMLCMIAIAVPPECYCMLDFCILW